MNRSGFLLLLVAAAASACSRGDPAAPVREAYQLERAAIARQEAEPPWFGGQRDRLFSRRLAELFAVDDRHFEATHDLGNLDRDPFLDAQDHQDDVLHDLVIDVVRRAGDRAEVRARFTNLSAATDLRFDVVREQGRWVIDDVRAAGRQGSLAGELAQPYYCDEHWHERCAPPAAR